MVELMLEMKLQQGDTIAILLTGSMPGANIAVLTAAETIGLVPVMITSLGASQWGANHVDFTWLDIEEILFNKGFISKRSIAASIGGRNDMGRLLSPAGRDIITNNISKHKLPLIKNAKLAENIDERMKLFSEYCNIKDFSAMINIGGGVASLGTSFNSKLLTAGIVKRADVIDISLREGGIEGALSIFAKKNVPILHVLNIKSLTEKMNMPFAPIPIPEIGVGVLYAEKKYNIFIAAVCLAIISGLVFGVGYHSKQKIKEHLVDHEPDSLL